MLGSISITRRRFAADVTSSTTGLVTKGASTDTTMTASVQPSPGTSTSEGLGGARSSDRIVVYAPNGDLRAEDQHSGLPADHVQYNGAWYEVQEVGAHNPSHLRLVHQRVIAVRLSENES